MDGCDYRVTCTCGVCIDVLRIIQKITIHRVNVRDRLNFFFFEDDSLAERDSRRLPGTAEPEGQPAKLTPFFRLCERAARATGRGRGRDSRPAVPGRFPVGQGERCRDRPCEAGAKTARRSKKHNSTCYISVFLTTLLLLLQ